MRKNKAKNSVLKSILKIVLRLLIVLLITVVMLVGTLYLMLVKIKNGPSESAKNLFITTIMETGQLKFVASLVCTPEEIAEIVGGNAMESMEAEVDASLITMDDFDSAPDDGSFSVVETFDENGIRIEEISGRTFFAKMMIIRDPSQVRIGSSYPWGEYGKELGNLIEDSGAVGGINGGLYVSEGNTGGKPLGVVVQGGEVTCNNPSINGLYMIGFDNNNILIIKDLQGMSSNDFSNYVANEGIRDAIAFQDEASDADNHFVPLIINGEARRLDGQGSGANPRSAIGQRADGAVLLLVTDGRGYGGHLGATASDLISIMQEYGAVNAANIDGGSSSSMYYNGTYEMSSVTFYYQNSSWKMPTAFVVMGGNGQ